ncbi:MAG: type II toxin-antitoxin system VapC family toxin [Terriglobales bacterium]
MRLLLDTHVLLWVQLEPERLPKSVRAALESPGCERFYSPLSVWEVDLLLRKRRLELAVDLPSWLAAVAARGALREVPLSTAIVLEASRMELAHGDPVDRFLAATAKLHGLTLVTADVQLRQRRDIAVLWS